MLWRALALSVIFLLPLPARAAGYVVRPGDTLGGIAQRYHVSVGSLARVNGIQNVNLVPIGRVLSIPQPVRRLVYRVQWGDTLSGIAARYGLTVSSIRSMNPSLGIYPLAGQILRLCSPCGGVASGTAIVAQRSSVVGGGGVYVVQPGDTLSGIAAAHGTTAGAIMRLNSLANADLVVIGTRLSLPGGSYAGTTATTTTSTLYNPVAVRSLITSEAYVYGVDPSLALAISWQESGFNQNMLSPTGAIGAMQVEPYTGSHISWLMGRTLNLYNVTDNVIAGVYWIATLVRYYGGDERWAAAAYYQGSNSLARRGWFDDTRQYVADVMSLRGSFGG